MLAEKLQLSAATVSKALNNSHEISEDTRRRVLALAAEYNYVPNPYAGSLRKKISNTIGVVIPEVADNFFAQAINGIEAIAQEKKYHVLIYLTHESYEKEQFILRDFQGGRVDGILLSVSAETPGAQHVRELQEKGIPVVLFDRILDEVDTTCIMTDDRDSAYKATAHLLQCGCKKIALLSVSDSLWISNKRREGYQQALAAHHVPFEAADVLHCCNNEAANYALIREALQQGGYDGVIASVERLSTIVYGVCAELQKRIPEDIKVLGFSNLSAAPYLNPSLTTITQPAFDMGKAAATALFRALKHKQLPKVETMVLPSRLIVRHSTV